MWAGSTEDAGKTAAVFSAGLTDQTENVLLLRKLPLNAVHDLVSQGSFHSQKLAAALKDGEFLQIFDVIDGLKDSAKLVGYLSPIETPGKGAVSFDPNDAEVCVAVVRVVPDPDLPAKETAFMDVVDAKNGVVYATPDNPLDLDAQDFFEDLKMIYGQKGVYDGKILPEMKTAVGTAILNRLLKPPAPPSHPTSETHPPPWQ